MKKWSSFFQTYRVIKIHNDNDLLFQVGATVRGKPISAKQHGEIINSIIKHLNLSKTDCLLDLCCGNGIITYDLSNKVRKIKGIDSSQPYILNALKFKNAPNIQYVNDDIMNIQKHTKNFMANKVLWYSSLAYFSANEFNDILRKLADSEISSIFIGSILDRDKKFFFFKTFKQKLNYLITYVILRKDLGLGKWWTKSEIEEIALYNGYQAQFVEQSDTLHTYHYRFDAILTNKNKGSFK